MNTKSDGTKPLDYVLYGGIIVAIGIAAIVGYRIGVLKGMKILA